jgi:hypothetical protein
VYHGGTIIASEKSEYRDQIDAEDLDAVVKGLIEEQHKAMLMRLRDGELDAVIIERLNGASPAAAPSGDTTSGAMDSGADTDPALDTDEPAAPRAAAANEGTPAFGQSGDSEKPLDEVILEYLVDKARGRSRAKKAQPRRQQRPKE